jgi:hypothetical protein
MVAWTRSRTGGAIQSLGQNSSYSSLADAAGAAEQKGMGHPTLFNGILQRPGNMFLPDYLIKILGTPLSG